MREAPFKRLRRSFREVGPLYTAQNVVKTFIPERVLRANTAFIFEANLRNWPPSQTDTSEVRWANESDSGLFEQNDMSEKEFLGYLANGAQIAICARDNTLLCYFIYETGDIDYYSWLRYRLTPDVTWTSMAWTAPQCRGQGIHGRVQQFALYELSRQGYKRKLATVDGANASSLRASIKKSNIAGSVSFLRSFNLTAVWVNGRLSIGNWNEEKRLVLGCDLFHSDPSQPYGTANAKLFDRPINPQG